MSRCIGTDGHHFHAGERGRHRRARLRRRCGLQTERLFSLRAAISLTDARVHQNPASVPGEPSLTGNRPAQAPTTDHHRGRDMGAARALRLDADLHWESTRFEDDQNTMKLGSAFVLDTRATWKFADALSASVYRGQRHQHRIARPPKPPTARLSYGQPRMYEVGVTYAP